MMRYVDYQGWVNYVVKVFRRWCRDERGRVVMPETVLDVACGSGIPTILLAKMGYRMVGVDRSREMLAVLEAKRGSLPIEVVCADIRDFRLPQEVDAAISLYDSINYLLTEEDLERCFFCVYRALKKSGAVFAFDMNTLYGLAAGWGTRTITRETDEVISIWQNQFDPETRISTLRLTFWEKLPDGELGEKMEELHQERGYTTEEVAAALRRAGFSQVHFYHHGGFLPVGPWTVRMMVVALK